MDVSDIEKHLLIAGEVTGDCSSCRELGINYSSAKSCPKCGNEFKYIAFQNVRDHYPKMIRIANERTAVQFIDHQDFKRIEGEEKAKGILG